MNRKIAAAIAVACILAALGAAGSIAYRVVAEDAAGTKAAEADFAALGSILAKVGAASDLAEPELRGRLAAHFSSSPSLLAAEVFERGVGTRWRMPADSPYPLGESGAGARLPSSTIRLTAPLGSDSTGALAIEALYVRVTQLSVFTAFRDALIALAAFLALASIVLAIASRPRGEVASSSSFMRGGPSEEAAQAASAAAAYQYETLSSGWEATPAETRVGKPAERKDPPIVEGPAVAEESELEKLAEEPGLAETPARSAPEEAFEPDFLADAEEAEEDFFLARKEARAPAPPVEDEFDIPEIDFNEDERPRPSAFEAKLDEPLPDMDMPSDDWMSAEARDAGAAESPGPLADIEELEAFDLEAAAPASSPASSPAPAADRGRAPEPASRGGAAPATPSAPSSPPSGLEPESRLAGRLASEIFRAASSGQELSLLRIEHEELTPAVPEYSDFARAIEEFFGAEDLAFERGRSGFAVMIPGADSRRAVEMADEFFKKLDFLAGGDAGELQFLPIFIGISSRSGRPVAADRLLAEADAAIRKAREDSESHIVAFRPDPERFKSFMASREG